MAVGSSVYGSQIKVGGQTEHVKVCFDHKSFGEPFASGDWSNKGFGRLFADREKTIIIDGILSGGDNIPIDMLKYRD